MDSFCSYVNDVPPFSFAFFFRIDIILKDTFTRVTQMWYKSRSKQSNYPKNRDILLHVLKIEEKKKFSWILDFVDLPKFSYKPYRKLILHWTYKFLVHLYQWNPWKLKPCEWHLIHSSIECHQSYPVVYFKIRLIKVLSLLLKVSFCWSDFIWKNKKRQHIHLKQS